MRLAYCYFISNPIVEIDQREFISVRVNLKVRHRQCGEEETMGILSKLYCWKRKESQIGDRTWDYLILEGWVAATLSSIGSGRHSDPRVAFTRCGD